MPGWYDGDDDDKGWITPDNIADVSKGLPLVLSHSLSLYRSPSLSLSLSLSLSPPENGSSQGDDLTLTVLYAPNSLDWHPFKSPSIESPKSVVWSTGWSSRDSCSMRKWLQGRLKQGGRRGKRVRSTRFDPRITYRGNFALG